MPSTPGPLPRRRDLRAPAAPAVPVLLVVVGAVLIAVSLAVLWGLSQGGTGDDARAERTTSEAPAAGAAQAGSPTTPEPATPPPATPAPSTTAAPAGAVEHAGEAMDALPRVSECDVYADAQVFHAYAEAVPGDTWPDLVSALRPGSVLEGLREPCGEDYEGRLAEFIVTDPRATELLEYTVRDHLGRLPQHHPAPDDARELETFRTADGNIGCTLTHDGVGCSVTTRSFADPPQCPDGAGGRGFSVALFTTEVYPCAGTISGGSTVLQGGRSTRVGDYACTAEGAGVRCWHTVSGTDFELSATAFRG